jgi:L-alanine-DL-glutamate epimerase-like enolase superfamily enzyme
LQTGRSTPSSEGTEEDHETPLLPYFGFISHAQNPAGGKLREAGKQLAAVGGDRIVLPDKPGLGFELNRDALRDFAVKAD